MELIFRMDDVQVAFKIITQTTELGSRPSTGDSKW
jgi:hypothetical protein